MKGVKVYQRHARTGGGQRSGTFTPFTPQVRGVTAIRAAVRAVAYAALGAVLVLVALAAMLWPAYGPQGLWTVAWLGVTGVVTAGCGVALELLGKRHRGARR